MKVKACISDFLDFLVHIALSHSLVLEALMRAYTFVEYQVRRNRYIRIDRTVSRRSVAVSARIVTKYSVPRTVLE